MTYTTTRYTFAMTYANRLTPSADPATVSIAERECASLTARGHLPDLGRYFQALRAAQSDMLTAQIMLQLAEHPDDCEGPLDDLEDADDEAEGAIIAICAAVASAHDQEREAEEARRRIAAHDAWAAGDGPCPY